MCVCRRPKWQVLRISSANIRMAKEINIFSYITDLEAWEMQCRLSANVLPVSGFHIIKTVHATPKTKKGLNFRWLLFVNKEMLINHKMTDMRAELMGKQDVYVYLLKILLRKSCLVKKLVFQIFTKVGESQSQSQFFLTFLRRLTIFGL